MRKHHFLFLLFAFLFLSGQALAQGPTIFVSTFGAHQILSVDGTTGATTVIHTGLTSFFPEDIVVGPDGNIYICDAPINIIWRLNPNTFQIETIYNLAGASPPNDPSGPEGPSFINDDLVFNTRGGAFPHTGVWKIAGVATIPFTGTIPPPVNLIDATGTGSTFGEGTAFDELGNLLIVDRSGNRILRVSAPSFAAPATVLIENPPTPAAPILDQPFGVAVNSNNEIFVANRGGSTFRNIQRFDSNGNFLGEFVNFRDDALDNPTFMEFDASDNLFVVTNQFSNATGGKVWRVDPAGSKTLLVDLSLELIDEDRDPDLASNRALGLAVPPTSTSITKFFSAPFSAQNYNFGTHSITIAFDQFFDFDGFAVTVTAEDVLPAVVALRTPGEPPCVQYASKGGFCVIYRVEPPFPIGGVNFDATNPAGGILLYIGYFTAGSDAGISGRIRGFSELVVVDDPDLNIDPILLHDPSGGTTEFSDDVTEEFFPLALPISELGTFCGFQPPVRADGSSAFKLGRTVPFKFKLSRLPDCSGDFITDAVAMISSIVKINGGNGGILVDDFESPGGANTGNLFGFNPGSLQYVFNLSTKTLESGTYVLTVTSDKFLPQKVQFVIR